MADALQASCAAPVFKRPRLEFSSCENDALISYESVSSEERFSIDSGLQDDSNEVTSSSDCHDDHPGGNPQSNRDFLSPDTNGVHAALDSIESHPIFEQSAHNGFISENPSSMLAHEAFSRSHPQPGDLEENDVEDQESTVSELSGLSDLSNLSGQDWKPT
ncbi:uncharacterized protein LOC118190008, partial [Stegodyphus dumicola]|uniref:uncharacterized protein LOC118190008 n=1 Tax=Stegodyphus dumicola TaxID=202533 RepID=UPI0015AEDD63